ncbi:hypothetical protein NIES23_39710 [Trichormus variabilis NIES-23]|uniref:Uncharacterized protein n=1 Tax=Trichormus variabilis NIES-23 TaxID=1973479 RepID=A0A1Z4KQ64_ANAVA|nr:hypothetical protein NIES23_39710 [Trichormus variabilis NIES-23]
MKTKNQGFGEGCRGTGLYPYPLTPSLNRQPGCVSPNIGIMVKLIRLLTHQLDKKYTEICIPILLNFCEDQNVGSNQSIADGNISEQINGASHLQKLCLCN